MMMVQANDIAFELFLKSCEGEVGEGCHFVGRFYDTGEAVEQDSAKALEYFEKACVAGRAGNSCYWAADMHRTGEMVEISEEKALNFYLLGCESENHEDCKQRAGKYLKGEEVFSKYYTEYKDTVEAMNARAKRHCRTIFWPC